jgi:8-oxo-dGTP pyrophosphatase MutT (NUDIX family)
VGSVATAHVPRLAAWQPWIAVHGPDAGAAPRVHLQVPRAARDAALATMNAALREEGHIRAWRDEPFSLLDPQDGRVLATFERASARFWGTLTLGAHANGYVADATGRPTHLWIARRAWNKATDPGCLDNLIGGGVPHGQTPLETVLREGWEEAGLVPAQMHRLAAGGVIELDRDVPEGRQFERLHVYDLELGADVVPANQDGEVAQILRLEVAQAAEVALSGEMTVDAALVTLDFLLRHGALPQAQQQALAPRLQALLRPA